jgi:hypothetical protein
MSKAGSWRDILVPGISFADTPKVRGFLERCSGRAYQDPVQDLVHLKPLKTPLVEDAWSNELRKPSLIGAWSNLDLSQATRMADDYLKSKPRGLHKESSNSIGPHFLLFLQNLARVDPEGAAKRLVKIQERDTRIGTVGNVFTKDALEVAKSLSPDCFPQLRKYWRYLAKLDKETGLPIGQLPEFMELASQVEADPIHSAPLLARMNSCPSIFRFMDLGVFQSGVVAVTATARMDQDAAIALSRVIRSPYDRSAVLLKSFIALKDVPFDQRVKLLDEAEAAANLSADGFERPLALNFAVMQAKQSYRALQPWPPVTP